MLPHVSPTTRFIPYPEDVLHHESSWDGWGVDPFLVLIEHLEGLNLGFLPQHRETLVEWTSNRNSLAEIGTVDIPHGWRFGCEEIVTTG